MEDLVIAKKQSSMFVSLSVILAYLLMNILYALLPKNSISEFFAYLVQPVFFIVVAFCFAKRQGNGVRKTLKLNKFKLKYLLYVLGLFFGLFFGLGYLNTLFSEALIKSGITVGVADIAMANFGEYLLRLISLSIAPAVGEELLFRSLLLFSLTVETGAENAENKANGYGLINDVLISVFIGLLFAFYHKNLAQLIYQFIAGVTLALIVIRSGSVIPAIIIHFLNNAVVLTVAFIDSSLNLLTLPLMIAGVIVFVVSFTLLILEGKKNEKCKIDYLSGLPYMCLMAGFCIIMLLLNIFA